MKKKITKVAITGGIGSGKSLFSSFLEDMGYLVLKADPLAKEIMNTNKDVREKIISAFGKEAYLLDGKGKINREFISKIAFTSNDKINLLNSIVHPVVIDELKRFLSSKHEKNVVFVEAALIFEAKIEKLFDYIILLTADESMRIERTMQRDKSYRNAIQQRIKMQIPDEKKKLKSHFIISNNGTMEELKKSAEMILNILTKI